MSVNLVLVVFVSGCTVANMAVSPFEKIALVASDDLNPDVNGRASPLRVKVLHLSSRATFDNLTFDEVFYNAKNLLSDELILEKTYTLQPKQKIKAKLPVDKGTEFVAVLAAYRNIDEARWRQVVQVSDKYYYSHWYQFGSAEVATVKRNRRNLANKELFDRSVETTSAVKSDISAAESRVQSVEALMQ